MINDNVLSNRLNEFKQKINSQNSQNSNNNSILTIVTSIITMLIVMFKTIIYGYGMKIIFCTSWNFWEVACIGLCINYFLEFLIDVIHGNKL